MGLLSKNLRTNSPGQFELHAYIDGEWVFIANDCPSTIHQNHDIAVKNGFVTFEIDNETFLTKKFDALRIQRPAKHVTNSSN